jgi:biotin carboxylase
MKPSVAIVDAYSSGALLAPEFQKHGFNAVMIQSTTPTPSIYRPSFRPSDFVEILPFRGNVAATASALRSGGAQLVIPGCESGVRLADELSERLGFLTNGSRLSRARRDKFLMTEAVRRHGLATLPTFRAGRLESLLTWIRQRSDWPVVVKPAASAGNDGVTLCFSESEVRTAFRNTVGFTNALGRRNHSVVAQKYTRGTEFVVDTVSRDGRHQVAAFWRYHKPPTEPFYIGYDAMELLDWEGESQRRLFDYVTRILDALEIRHGPAHTELMWTDDGLFLLEVGARMNGGTNPLISRRSCDRNQLDLTLDCYLTPDRFFRQLGQPYRLSQQATLVFLTPRTGRRLIAIPGLAKLGDLPSFCDMCARLPNVNGSPRVIGWVVLMHRDKAVLERDLQHIRELEQDGLYQYAA